MRFRVFQIPALLIFIVCACTAGAENDPAERIHAALARHPTKARVGVSVRRMSDGKEVFAARGSDLFELASNTKLFTTAAALHRLGPDYEFRTPLIANGRIEGGALKGDLVVVGGGDPNFSGRAFGGNLLHVPRQFAAAVQAAGIKEVTGDLVMDDRLFDRTYRAPGWPPAESLWWYGAPVSAFSFNDNCTEVKVTAGSSAGAPTSYVCIPPCPALKLINRAVTCGRGEESEVAFARDAGGAILVTGKLPVGTSRSETVAVDEPALFLAATLRAEIEKLGVRIAGNTRLVRSDEQARDGAWECFAWKSRLVDAMNVANRRSQNLYAEMILKTLGARTAGVGSFDSGAAAVMEFVKSARLTDGTVALVDGCGLSTGDRATPQAVSALLEVMYRSRHFEVYRNSLACNGDTEGTLRNRMADAGMRGRIHAKTGTIRSGGVSALSGYIRAADGDIYAFSILTNGFQPAGLGAMRSLEDAVCQAIAGVAEKGKKK